jgi:riboflavin synthase
LRCTNLGDWQVGSACNLERALCMGEELGGHIVSGHVDGVGVVHALEYVGDNLKISIRAPQELKRFIATKGSVTMNGVSLTVNGVDDDIYWVNLIAHTLQETTLGALKQDDTLNVEIDMLARYVERMQTA